MEVKNADMEKSARMHRWRKDEQGWFNYRGRCPFNNGLCKILNRLAEVARRY
jgi:hypothetical protein